MACMSTVSGCKKDECLGIKYVFRIPDGMVFTVLAYIPYYDYYAQATYWIIPGEFNPKPGESPKVSYIKTIYKGSEASILHTEEIASFDIYYTLNKQFKNYNFLKNKLIISPRGTAGAMREDRSYWITDFEIVNVPNSEWEILEYSRSHNKYLMAKGKDTTEKLYANIGGFGHNHASDISYVHIEIGAFLRECLYHIGYPLPVTNNE